MSTLRRLYAYGAVLAALEVWLWSLSALLTKALRGTAWATPEALAGALAGFLIGLPVFWLHWRWVQHTAAEENEDRYSPIRATALYLALALTWGVVFHGGTALLARGLERWLPLPSWAHLFPTMDWARALAVVVVHGLAGWYFVHVLAREEPAFTETQTLVRRWYRFLWMTYGLGWMIFGLQQLLTVFAPPPGMFTAASLSRFAAQGIVLLAGGALLWGWWGRRWWHHVLIEPAENRSAVTVGFLMTWALLGLIVGLAVVGMAVNRLLQLLLGDSVHLYPAMRLVATLGIPWIAVWLGAQGGLAVVLRRWESETRAAAYRLFLSVVAYFALTAAVSTGVAGLLGYLSHALFGTIASHQALTGGITLLLIGGPLWTLSWQALQREALADEAARQTMLRRAYLYLVLFAALLALMGFATAGAFQLLRALLGGHFDARPFFFATGMGLWTAGMLWYHARVLMTDRKAESSRAKSRETTFSVLMLAAPEAKWAAALRAAAPSLAFVAYPPQGPPPNEGVFRAVVLTDDILLSLSPKWQAWLSTFGGVRLIVPTANGRWLWLGNDKPLQAAAKALRVLAGGKRPRPCQPHPLWTILAYIGVFSLISWGVGFILPVIFAFLLGMH